MDKRILNNLVAKLANADLCESSKNDKLSFLIRELVANLETEKEIESVLEILLGPDEPIEFAHGVTNNSNLKHLGTEISEVINVNHIKKEITFIYNDRTLNDVSCRKGIKTVSFEEWNGCKAD